MKITLDSLDLHHLMWLYRISPSPFDFEEILSITLLQSRKLVPILSTGVYWTVFTQSIYTERRFFCPTKKNSTSAQSKCLRYCKPAMTRAVKSVQSVLLS